MGRVEISLGALPMFAVGVRSGCTRIGRAADNDIVLPLPEVADFHAEIVSSEGHGVVRSVGDETVLLNGQEVDEASLAPGDRIQLGGYRLRWLEGDEVGEDDLAGQRQPTVGLLPTLESEATDSAVTRVVVVVGPDMGRDVTLDAPVFVIGRAPGCDLVLNDDTASWRHVSLERTREGVRVLDLGSRNGTFLGGRRIESVEATTGTRVRIGRTTFLLAGAREPDRDRRPGLAELTGGSSAMKTAYERIREASASRIPVLLLGETGTGKELAARALHSLSPRAPGPFVPVNCAAIPRDMIEAELFGHARGAFTGAVAERRGAFEAATGGAIFLDEIAEMPFELQPKLLRVLEDGEVPRVGGGTFTSDFRVIAATNRDIRREVSERRFRDDLYYRIAVFPIELPPLRERMEDLPDLVSEFLRTAERHTGVAETEGTHLAEDALEPLLDYSWPGNVRELRNLILRAVVRQPGKEISRALMEELLQGHGLSGPPPASVARSHARSVSPRRIPRARSICCARCSRVRVRLESWESPARRERASRVSSIT